MVVFLLIFLALAGGVFFFLRRRPSSERRACVLVLGDFGRSPRMQYHSLSLAKAGFAVDVVAYGGSTPHNDVVSDSKIEQHCLQEPPAALQRVPRLVRYFVKVLYQVIQLFFVLYVWVPCPSHVLLQNPPAIPTMALAWLVCRLRGSRLIIDWHNYGYSILQLSTGSSHPLARFAKWYEHFFGRLADRAVCVTGAMRDDLRCNWSIAAVTMHDRPPEIFQPLDITAQHELLIRLSQQYPVFRVGEEDTPQSSAPKRSAFTEVLGNGKVQLRPDRPALLVSSTSWTEDEDFSILLCALDRYEEAAGASGLPRLVCAITGKGPLKEFYTQQVAKRSWKHVAVVTPWLEAADYPRLLGSADVGVSLHISSSGLDLPMKVVDMFGCGLPVLAARFSCLNELVKDGENGLVFTSEEELADQIKEVFADFPRKQQLKEFSKNLEEFRKVRWQTVWEENVLPLFVA